MMRFNKTTAYAIRILIYLGDHLDSAPHSATILHKDLHLPYKYVTKLMTSLAKHGLVTTTRGRVGGFTLAKSSDEIYLKEIVKAIVQDYPEEHVCILGYKDCTDENPCKLHRLWVRPKKEIEEILETTKLKELLS